MSLAEKRKHLSHVPGLRFTITVVSIKLQVFWGQVYKDILRHSYPSVLSFDSDLLF